MKVLVAGVLIVLGLILIAPAAVTWNANQIQAGLGNGAPLLSAAARMGVGLLFCAGGWKLVMK